MKISRRDLIRTKILERCIEVDGPLSTPCLVWTGPTSGTTGRGAGYGRMCLDGGTVAPHKAYFICEEGPIPPGKQLDHVCRNRLCIRHTEMVTQRENCRRRELHRGSQTGVVFVPALPHTLSRTENGRDQEAHH